MSVSSIITQAARALESCPQVMASALAAYRRHTGQDDAALAEMLALTPERLSRLALCRRPSPASPTFADEVTRLATYVACSADALALLLRRVATDILLAGGPPSGHIF